MSNDLKCLPINFYLLTMFDVFYYVCKRFFISVTFFTFFNVFLIFIWTFITSMRITAALFNYQQHNASRNNVPCCWRCIACGAGSMCNGRQSVCPSVRLSCLPTSVAGRSLGAGSKYRSMLQAPELRAASCWEPRYGGSTRTCSQCIFWTLNLWCMPLIFVSFHKINWCVFSQFENNS